MITGTIRQTNRCAFIEGDDYYPELLISRFPAGNEDELARELSRVEQYERNPSSHGNPWWFTSVTAIASWMTDGSEYYSGWNGRPDFDWAQEMLLLFKGYYSCQVPDQWLTEEYFYYGDETDESCDPEDCPVYPQGVADRVNEGRSWLSIQAHGSPDAWFFECMQFEGSAFAVFWKDNIDLLQNDGMLPFVFSVACDVADWNSESVPTMTKIWMSAGTVNNPTGSVGFFGAATSLPWTPPQYAHIEAVKVMLGWPECSPQTHTTGAICFAGISHMIDLFSWVEDGDPWVYGPYRRALQCWLLHGDCSMQIRTMPPEPIAVTHPTHVGWYGIDPGETITIPLEISDIGPDEKVTATIVRESGGEVELLDRTYCTGPGVYSLVAPAGQDCILHLTVSGLNKQPYEKGIDFIERYRGSQFGVQKVRGTFLVDGDVRVPVDHELTIERWSAGNGIFYIAEDDACNYGIYSNKCEFVVEHAAKLHANVWHFGLDQGLTGTWGGFTLLGPGSELTIEGLPQLPCTITKAENGIYATDFASVELSDCIFYLCSDSGVKWMGGVADADITSTTFQDCTWGIRVEGCASGSDIQVSGGCEFSNCWKGIEVVGQANLDVAGSTFYSSGSDLDWGAVFRDNCSGSVSNCTFECSGGAYHGIDCRAGNSSVTVEGNQFNGPGGFNCAAAINNRAIYAFGSNQNFPRIRSNRIIDFWYAVGAVGGSLADLGHEPQGQWGQNEFGNGNPNNANCCDVQFACRSQEPPGTLYAQGNCWNGSPDVNDGTICGNWAAYVEGAPGYCGQQDGVPPLVPETLALRVLGPNPFSDVVEIQLDLPDCPNERGLKIEIVDLAGRTVKEYSLDELSIGSHRLQWDGRGAGDRFVPNGVYICRTRVDGRQLSDKIVFLRESE